MDNKIIKLCLFSIIVLFISTLISCKKNSSIHSYSEMDRIIYQSILSKEDNYLVFIYGDNCIACEELEELLCQYATKAKNKKSYMPIFALNSSNTRVNKGLIATGGDDSYSDFKNTSNYLDIQISTTPALIIVKDGKVSDYISTKVTKTPKTDIKEYMNNLMK